MRAAVCTRYGPPDVLQLTDVADPRPGHDDLLVRIHASTVSTTDCRVRSGVPKAPLWFRVAMRLFVGVTRPRRPILGSSLAGEVVAVGKRVTRFRPGDRVYAYTMMRFGCYAEYARVRSRGRVARIPANVTYEEAAAIPYGALLALHFVRAANIRPADEVLIYGASGAVGTTALQLAKHFGARVTAVCGASNAELVRSIGADAVLDYTSDRTPGDARFSLVFDAVGKRRTSALKDACRNALTPGGRYISVDSVPRYDKDTLEFLAQLAEEGNFKAVIDRRFPLEQVADAHRYHEQGHTRGNVVITVQESR